MSFAETRSCVREFCLLFAFWSCSSVVSDNLSVSVSSGCVFIMENIKRENLKLQVHSCKYIYSILRMELALLFRIYAMRKSTDSTKNKRACPLYIQSHLTILLLAEHLH